MTKKAQAAVKHFQWLGWDAIFFNLGSDVCYLSNSEGKLMEVDKATGEAWLVLWSPRVSRAFEKKYPNLYS